MSLLRHFGGRKLITQQSTITKLQWNDSNLISSRTYLTSQYLCEDSWNRRLQNSSLKQISPERYFFELNQRYQHKKKVSAVDVDIYVNSVSKLDNQHELEHILRQFRKSRLTVDIHESTHHAICRFYLSNSSKSSDPLFRKLLEILNQRVEYGIFPDRFIYNALLDRSILDRDLDGSGFETVKLMMLQEDSGNDISRTLALYILSELLVGGKVDPKTIYGTGHKEDIPEKEEPEVDEDDIEYIRVPYLINKYFDDHFDLIKRSSLFGKSLYFFGYEVGRHHQEESNSEDQQQILSLSTMIIGLIYWEKFEKLNKILDRFSMKNNPRKQITIDVTNQIEKCLHCETIDDNSKSELTKLNERLQSSFEVVPDESSNTISKLISKRLEKIPQFESKDCEELERLFLEFEKLRVDSIDQQLEQLLQQERRKELEAKKQELIQKQRLYYFFENFPQHEIDFVEAEKRIKELKSKTVVDEDYVPPEIY